MAMSDVGFLETFLSFPPFSNEITMWIFFCFFESLDPKP